ncbi:choice-of-anchor tandem repeat GloVer-containing protein [Reichenbachiella versicolor]|uniref:choice-of-anchor tandem repeat GloVer-containing protein n=1 Tax=Reichenbachiella versicolor TaxID=1821036 RepID=UPI000D6E7D89|nr:choice-of-anchor tandem repeat GloVer-containing protein [Reichenbachiella versicolor]
MKKTLLFIALAILTHGLSAQVTELWGSSGSGSRNGSIFKFDVNKEYQHVLDVPDDGEKPIGNLVEVREGVFYGMTEDGGTRGRGTIFRYDEADTKYQLVHSFGITEDQGEDPRGSLLHASDGLLYGVTFTGGVNDKGTIFSYDPEVGTYEVLYHFVGDGVSDRANPSKTLLEGSDGKLYGVTGSYSGNSSIFSFDPRDKTFALLHKFSGTPNSLIEGNAGVLYGSTLRGGSSDKGVLFSFDTSDDTYTKLYDFDGTTHGGTPVGALMFANDGKLYGSTYRGGANGDGILYSYDVSGAAGLTVLHDFDYYVNGYGPRGSLIQAANGKLYGVTFAGRTSATTEDRGVLFSYDLAGVGFKVEHSFEDGQADHTIGSLIEGSNGKLYAVSSKGGVSGLGVIYNYDPASEEYASLYELINWGKLLDSPNLMQAKDGMLYGVALRGGNNSETDSQGDGVLFRIDPFTSQYTKLHDFKGSTGGKPGAGVIEGEAGVFYGTTSAGGAYGDGVIFKYDVNSKEYTVLYHFDGFKSFKVTLGSDGKLYGVTFRGGKSDKGLLYSYDINSSSFSKLADFDDIGASFPFTLLTEVNRNLFYGVTNYGVLYSYDLVEGKLTKHHDFRGIDGSAPSASLLKSRKSSTLYGTTRQGGSNDMGVIFSYEPATNTYTKLYDFDSESGIHSYFGLVEDKDGVLYGIAREGGEYDEGTMYKFNTADNSFEKIHDFAKRSYDNLLQVRICQPEENHNVSAKTDCQFEAPTINDACLGMLTGTTEDELDFEANKGTTKDVSWTFDDGYGYTFEATQSITFDDVTNPVPDLEELPEIISDKEILESSIVIPTATDDCSSNITVTHDIEFPITRSVKINWTFDDNHGNKISQTQNVVINSTLSVGEDLESDFTVYPNPASGIITINSTSRELVQVLSLEGVVLLSSDKKTIDISTLSTGIYIIKQGSKVTQFIKE